MAEEVKYYEILFIPFAFNFQDRPYKKYGFKLSIGTTFVPVLIYRKSTSRHSRKYLRSVVMATYWCRFIATT